MSERVHQITEQQRHERSRNTFRLRLDVDIGGFDIELSSMPKQTSIGNELQYQICCLDASEIASWN